MPQRWQFSGSNSRQAWVRALPVCRVSTRNWCRHAPAGTARGCWLLTGEDGGRSADAWPYLSGLTLQLCCPRQRNLVFGQHPQHPLASLIHHCYPLSTPSSLPTCRSPHISSSMSVYGVRFRATTQAWLELRDPDARNAGSPVGLWSSNKKCMGAEGLAQW